MWRPRRPPATSVRLTDQRSGQSFDVSAGAVINAAGVWAGDIDPVAEVTAQPRNASGVRRRVRSAIRLRR